MKVSVIIPTHNRADALRKTLERLARQDFKEPWEVVVVNNLTDDTTEVVKNYKFPASLTLVEEKTPV